MLAASPVFTGSGARQVVFDGRSTNPLITLVDELELPINEDETEDKEVTVDDIKALDEGELPFEPLPPPPQETSKIKVVIITTLLKQFSMAITSEVKRSKLNLLVTYNATLLLSVVAVAKK